MNILWGLIKTHEHTFNPENWKSVGVFNIIHTNRITEMQVNVGEVDFIQNKCLTCGDVIERKLTREI